MKKHLILTILFTLFGCAGLSYKVVESYDEYEKTGLTYEYFNRVQNMFGSMYLNLNKFDKSNDVSVFLTFTLKESGWIFIEEKESFQFLFTDGEVLKLSPVGRIDGEVDSGGGYVGVEESGQIAINKSTLKLLLDKDIKSLRVIGRQSNREYNNFATMQLRWREFSQNHLNEFLKEE
tara:strand:+ start:121 stop:651 length:531 start_codon:yes stop_codon:yes gene_type:complete